MSTYNKRTLEPRIIDELTRIKEIKKKRFCSRHEIMNEINFPSSTPARVVIKSNEKGTGFMRNFYNEEYCKDYISKKEFDAIVDKVSLIIGNEYSRKRKLDSQGISLKNGSKCKFFSSSKTHINLPCPPNPLILSF